MLSLLIMLASLLGPQSYPTEVAPNATVTERTVATIPEIRVNTVRAEAFDVLELQVLIPPGVLWTSEPFDTGNFDRAFVRFEITESSAPVRCTLLESMLGDDDYTNTSGTNVAYHELPGWSQFIDLGDLTGRFGRIQCENVIQTVPADVRRVRVLLRR